MARNRVLAFPLLVFAAGYLALTFLIPEPSGGYAAIGPRAFPLMIGIGLIICSIWIGVGRARSDPARETPVNWPLFGSSAVSFLAYILLLGSIGYVLATVGFITLESRLLGSRSWSRNLIVGCVITALVYGIFGVLLEIPLPEGLIR